MGDEGWQLSKDSADSATADNESKGGDLKSRMKTVTEASLTIETISYNI